LYIEEYINIPNKRISLCFTRSVTNLFCLQTGASLEGNTYHIERVEVCSFRYKQLHSLSLVGLTRYM